MNDDKDWCQLHQRPDTPKNPCRGCDLMDIARDNYKDAQMEKQRGRKTE